ncbi:MAG: hypothetical protein IK032_07410, partial [Bacteroidales bacterium]|nr:hypothetical protein [Bacteroidales bacterium]
MKPVLTVLFVAVALSGACCQRVSQPVDPEGMELGPAILGIPVTQVSIPRIESMPNLPSPYKMLDWRQKA